MNAALKVIGWMVFYMFLMPVAAVISFHYYASTFSSAGPYYTGHIITDFVIATSAAVVWWIALQRSLLYRRIWLNLFKRP